MDKKKREETVAKHVQLFIFICVCVCMVRACLDVCGHMCVCLCVCTCPLEPDTCCLSLSFSTSCIEAGSLTWTLSLPVRLVWLASLLQRFFLLFPSPPIIGIPSCPLSQHLHQCYRLELGSSCMASTLLTEPSSQSHFIIAQYFIKEVQDGWRQGSELLG